MIIVENVSKKYGKEKVLDDVSFRIDGGEFVSIVGSSGAGKTTLIHALIGAKTIDSGMLNVDNLEIPKLKSSEIQAYRRKIGIVFQDYKLLPQKTVFENVAFALEVNGMTDDFIQKRTVEVLKLVGLETKRNQFPRQLSGGERQRTALARALVHNPELLIADEPTGNLDPENALALAKLLLKINSYGTTVILATHNKEIVNGIKKRVITLDRGKLISDKKNATYK
ncbi:cell division ATP-binding protein FtsE [Candidatus Peregrinibacteria bacterium CG10_big_fil_rev_8_21_14_0_10_36_19]|nr:MAG: cell division ATP-binding protein FtsE [Candidatus Peregrinibacteria bacterium CG10_big_fil_rev_8_21_14_0_10_36_19]